MEPMDILKLLYYLHEKGVSSITENVTLCKILHNNLEVFLVKHREREILTIDGEFGWPESVRMHFKCDEEAQGLFLDLFKKKHNEAIQEAQLQRDALNTELKQELREALQ